MNKPVGREQRWTKNSPCRVCGGHESMPQHKGIRCHGFRSTDGEYLHCTRSEYANGLTPHKRGDTYAHKAEGDCKCGSVHGLGARAAGSRPVSGEQKTLSPRRENGLAIHEGLDLLTSHWRRIGKRRGEVRYEFAEKYVYNDANSEPYIVVGRFEAEGPEGCIKTFSQASRQGSGWSETMSGTEPIPYRLPELIEAMASGETIHVVEGEKNAEDVCRSGGVATCNIGGAGKRLEPYVKYFKAKTSSRFLVVADVGDTDSRGERHAENWRDLLRNQGHAVEVVVATDGLHDASDALKAGYALADAFEVDEELNALTHEQRAKIDRHSRFDITRTSIDGLFDQEPKPRDFIIDDFLPDRISGLLVATGGTGKGHLQIMLTITRALGLPFGPYAAKKPCGTVLVSMEDDLEEFHRRFDAALRATWAQCRAEGESFGDWKCRNRNAVSERIRFVDLLGLTGEHLGPELRDAIANQVDHTADARLVIIDPLTRLLPPGLVLNDNAAAGTILNELDAIRNETGCTVIAAHHSNKESVRSGGELKVTAATGSFQLTDLSRWALLVKSLNAKESADYGLEEGRHYIEAALPKSNYTPRLDAPMIFRRETGGALVYVEARGKGEVDADHALTELLKLGEWIEGKDWLEVCKEAHGMSKGRFDKAKRELRDGGSIQCVSLKSGQRKRATVFGPSEAVGPTRWPAQPTAEEWFKS